MVKPRTHRARGLRKDATAAERLLWRALRDAALPVRIRRQHPIGRYIADFAIPARKLVIEIDGGQHVTAARRDAARTGNLEARGWRVIRFWNNDVTGNLAGVLETIVAEIERRLYTKVTIHLVSDERQSKISSGLTPGPLLVHSRA